MGYVTQKIIQLIKSGKVVPGLMPIASYSLPLLVEVFPGDDISFDKHPFRVRELIDIYGIRERNLNRQHIEHGGFLETISSLKQIDDNIVHMLITDSSGYSFTFLLDVKTEIIVGILYVKQSPDEKPGHLASFFNRKIK